MSLRTNHMVPQVLRQGPILLYDGECGVCAASVQFILQHERRHSLRFAALQSELGQRLREAAGVTCEVDSLLWIDAREQQVVALKWSEAVLAVASYLGGGWGASWVLRVVPRGLRDAAYRLFARHRKRWASSHCPLPTQDQRARFLDG